MVLSLLFPIFFLLLSLGEVGRLSFFGQQINGYLYEPALALILLVFIFQYRVKPLKSLMIRYKAMLFFLALMLISYIVGWFGFTLAENAVSFLYVIRLIMYFAFYVYLNHALKHNVGVKKDLYRGLFVFVCATVISSILQYIFYPELRNLLYLGWDPHLYRMFGTFLDTSVAAAIYGISAFFSYFLVKDGMKKSVIKYILLILSFLCLILTFSRTSYIIFFLLTIALLLVEKRYKLLFISFVFAVGLLVIIPKPFGEGVNLARTFSIESRLNDYRNAAVLWAKKPVLGFGYNRIRYAKKQYGLIESKDFEVTHAGASFPSFLEILVTNGVVGLIAFIWMWHSLLKRNKVGLIIGAYVMLLSLADNILLHPVVLILFLSILSLSEFSYPLSSSPSGTGK